MNERNADLTTESDGEMHPDSFGLLSQASGSSISVAMKANNEAFSRVLIDKALEFSSWDLLDSHQVRFGLNTATGRPDYLLGGHRGPLRVLEAKREDVDPDDAKEQARG